MNKIKALNIRLHLLDRFDLNSTKWHRFDEIQKRELFQELKKQYPDLVYDTAIKNINEAYKL